MENRNYQRNLEQPSKNGPQNSPKHWNNSTILRRHAGHGRRAGLEGRRDGRPLPARNGVHYFHCAGDGSAAGGHASIARAAFLTISAKWQSGQHPAKAGPLTDDESRSCGGTAKSGTTWSREFLSCAMRPKLFSRTRNSSMTGYPRGLRAKRFLLGRAFSPSLMRSMR